MNTMKIAKRLFGVVIMTVLLSGLFVVWFQRQNLYDWYQLRGYEPPVAVRQLADKTTMTDYGRRLFYVNQPVIADQREFNEKCQLEASIVLGCYIPQDGIYLYNINEPRLQGIMEVTAAHEMLHVAYDRLDNKERERIDALTSQAFQSVASERVRNNIENYKRQNQSVVPNELHSILATEVRELPEGLESYYRQYFNNRQTVVNFSEQYESEFETRKSQVQAYDDQLAALKLEIDGKKAELAIQMKNLQAEKSRLESLLSAGRVEEYNAAVPDFNAQIAEHNNLVRQTDQLITRFNEVVHVRNSIAVEVQDLAEAIDSRPQSF